MEAIYKLKYLKYKTKYLKSKNLIKAIAFFNSDIKGYVKFEELNDNTILIDVNLEGLTPKNSSKTGVLG
jgi:hypothetical protein